jgi:glycine/D-amino acid oxidase-like deaminating enzyme/nitrite reductase/ring-hydroxylating ferredoxin subunit
MGSLHETNPSLWVATTASGRRHAAWAPPGPEVDVAVVGAGIAGLSTALALAERGARVAVLEAGAICSGVTGYTTAKVTSLHGLTYATLAEKRGDDIARSYASGNQSGVAQVARWVETYSIDCDFSRRAAFTYTLDAGREPDIAAEVRTAQRLGLPASATTETDLPYDVVAAVRFDDQAQFHPRRYCLGLAAAVTGLGGSIYEDTRVVGVDVGTPCRVVTERGSFSVPVVVLATHLPFLDRAGFFLKTWPSRSYALALELADDAPIPRGMYLDADRPVRSVRSAVDDSLVIVGGEGHKVGQEPDTQQRYAALERWARDTFPVASIPYRWSAQDYMPVDGTPFVGRHAARSPIFVATGFGKWGMSNGTAAGLLLAALIDGTTYDWHVAFDATRIKSPLRTAAAYRQNADAVGGHLLGDRVRTRHPPPASGLGPGQGGIVDLDGQKVAAFRHDDGTLTAVSPECTHVGCLVAFNTAERTWDCPCHGSRYTIDGAVIQGPALRDLEPRQPARRDPRQPPEPATP